MPMHTSEIQPPPVKLTYSNENLRIVREIATNSGIVITTLRIISPDFTKVMLSGEREAFDKFWIAVHQALGTGV